MASGAEGSRTLDLCIANAALSQLSYRPDSEGPKGLCGALNETILGSCLRAVYPESMPLAEGDLCFRRCDFEVLPGRQDLPQTALLVIFAFILARKLVW